MSQEYSFTLTVPLTDLSALESLIDEIRKRYPSTRISRKSDRKEWARYYLSFPFSSTRPDLKFQQWFEEQGKDDWDLFGPTYGRWGFI